LSDYTPTYTSGTGGLVETVKGSLAGLYRRRWLAVYFAQRELSRTHRSSYLGFLWALLSPLLQIVLLTLVFSEIVGIKFREVTGDGSLNFGLYLYCGLIPFLAFSDTLAKATNSVRSNTALVQKVVFPLEILPLTRAVASVVDTLFGLGALILVVALVAQRLEWTILLLPLLMAVQLLFILGIGYLFAVIGTYMPDIRNALRVFLRAMFFLTPIVWPAEWVPEHLRFLVDYNPLAFLVSVYRDLILEGTLPDLSAALWFSVFAGGLCIVGFVVFARAKQNFADLL
jgi:ABC-type polysaccharide/polyol phosphate export permease